MARNRCAPAGPHLAAPSSLRDTPVRPRPGTQPPPLPATPQLTSNCPPPRSTAASALWRCLAVPLEALGLAGLSGRSDAAPATLPRPAPPHLTLCERAAPLMGFSAKFINPSGAGRGMCVCVLARVYVRAHVFVFDRGSVEGEAAMKISSVLTKPPKYIVDGGLEVTWFCEYPGAIWRC